MSVQDFETYDVLALQVEQPPAAGQLRNLVPNPSGALGGWGWITPVAGTTMQTAAIGDRLSYTNPNPSALSYFFTENMRVTAGQYVAAVIPVHSGFGQWLRLRFDALDDTTQVVGSSPYTAVVSADGVPAISVPAYQTPPGSTKVRLRVEVWGNNVATTNPPAGSSLNLQNVTVANAGTAAALAGLAFIPASWLTIMGQARGLTLDRAPLDVGELTGQLFGADLDPSQAGTLLPGRRCRLIALATSEPLFTGKLRRAVVTFDGRAKPGKQTSIELSATDAVTDLAGEQQRDGVASIPELAAILEGAGVPWNLNGSTSQIPAFVVAAKNDQASLLDQVVITRDSVLGHAWIGRKGVLNVFDEAQLSNTVQAVLDESVYTDINIDYDTDRCINSVSIVFLRTNPSTGETEEVPYGPYEDAASIETWGRHPKEFRIQQLTEDPTAIASYAASILAANAVPAVRVNEVTYPIRDIAHDAILRSSTSNEIANPGFEAGAGPHKAYGCTLGTTALNVHSGAQAGLLTNLSARSSTLGYGVFLSANGPYDSAETGTPITAGDQLHGELWVRNNNAAGSTWAAHLRAYDAAGALISTASGNIVTVSAAHQRTAVDWTAPAGSAFVTLSLLGTNTAAGGSIIVDDWNLTRTASKRAAIDLLDLVHVSNADAGVSEDLRVQGVTHTIDPGRWTVTLAFSRDGQVATPIPTPAPSGSGSAGQTISELLRPIGEVTMFYGTAAQVPAGWLELNGAAFSSATYPKLASFLGSTTLPDFNDRFPVGASTAKAVGSAGGASTVTMPDHTHGIGTLGTNNTGSAHTHNLSPGTTQTNTGTGGTASRLTGGGDTGSTGSGHTHGVTGATGAVAGANPAIASVPPYRALRFIIRAR